MQVLSDVAPLPPTTATSDGPAVPEVLENLVFGQPDPKVKLNTFAVLDAARIVNLVETLAASDLDHACLFEPGQGLDDVAPWLVELAPDHALTRNLFTHDPTRDVAWFLWDKSPGIILRSLLGLDDLRAHFRRFVQVPVAQSKPVFLRFWDPRFLGRYMVTHHPEADNHIAGFIGQSMLILPDAPDACVRVVQGHAAPVPRAKGDWPHLMRDAGKIRFSLFRTDLPDRMAKRFDALQKLDRPTRKSLFSQMIDDAVALRLTDERAIERYCLACLMLGGRPQDDPRFDAEIHSPQHELDRSRKILGRAQQIAEG